MPDVEEEEATSSDALEQCCSGTVTFCEKFAVFKEDPVRIQGFHPEVQIMLSKEKPKKIGIIGSDGRVYHFLLKCDKMGDLRKEARFIEYANLVNKMLESDSQSRQRSLKLLTFAILPLSRNTGLIEWMNSTATLKHTVSEYWKKEGIKGDMA